jgi:hypothetical protein
LARDGVLTTADYGGNHESCPMAAGDFFKIGLLFVFMLIAGLMLW